MNKFSILCPAVPSALSSTLRKSFFLLCASSFSGGAYAYSTVDQTGNAHVATVEQSEVYSSGIHITQSGESDNAAISQTTVFYNADNEIHQAGELNDAFIEQRNLAHAPASGSAASTGTGNLIQILQTDQVADNVANAEAIQFGDANEATIVQQNNESGSLTATIYQEGLGNAAWIYQTEIGSADAEIEQIGDHNRTTVYQTMSTDSYDVNNQVSASISGSNNDLIIRQSGADSSSVSFVQFGDGSVAEIDQSGFQQSISLNSEGSHNNSDIIRQTIFTNSALVSRVGGSENETNIHQGSLVGDVIVEQITSVNVAANVIQEGDGAEHEVAILQTDSEMSVASIEQSGVANSANIVQNNAMNSEAYISQPCWECSSEITQVMGADNYAAIVQINDGSGAAITQTGNSNYAVISQ